MTRFSRREFMATAAAVAAAGQRGLSAQGPVDLTVYFLGLCFFERLAGEVNVGLVNGPAGPHSHSTVILVPTKALVKPPSPPQPPGGVEWGDWRLPETPGAATDYTAFRPASSFDLTCVSATKLSHTGIKNLFPLTSYGDNGRLDKNWSSKCASKLSFTNGRFRDNYRVSPKCGHTDAAWDAMDSAGNVNVEGWKINDYVTMSAAVTSVALDVDGPIGIDLSKVSSGLRIYVARFLTNPDGHAKNQSEHCRHYFPLLDGSVSPVWPYRVTVPTTCVDSDPVFCPPAM